MQTDPVHSDRDGYDVYDRYMYVHGNPVAFTDPDGECAALVIGNYSGPGSCNKHTPLRDNILEASMEWGVFNSGGDIEIAKKLAMARFLYWTYIQKPVSPLSEIDKSSEIHDAEFPGFFSPEYDKSINADTKWIKRNYMFFLKPHYWGNTYEREFNAAPDWMGNTGKSIAAVFGTIGTFFADWQVYSIGSVVFVVHVVVQTIRREIYQMAHISKNRTFIHKGRYKNLLKPSGWKL
jgi:hypothetical protein